MKKVKDKYRLGYAHELPKTDKRLKKFAKQRKDRGWDSTELWNLDVTIAKFVLPRLKEFIKTVHDDYKKDIQKMIDAFELVVSDDNYRFDKEIDRKIRDGLKTFSENFRLLWN